MISAWVKNFQARTFFTSRLYFEAIINNSEIKVAVVLYWKFEIRSLLIEM